MEGSPPALRKLHVFFFFVSHVLWLPFSLRSFVICLCPFDVFALPFADPLVFCLLPFSSCLLPFASCLVSLGLLLLSFAFCSMTLALFLLPVGFCFAFCLLRFASCKHGPRQENTHTSGAFFAGASCLFPLPSALAFGLLPRSVGERTTNAIGRFFSLLLAFQPMPFRYLGEPCAFIIFDSS